MLVAEARSGALPTFFVIGAARSGTTSLHYYLSLHPEIQMSAMKEPHFFAGPPGDLPFGAPHVSDLEEYRRLFDPSCAVRGEASPSYSAYPRRTGVPERIRRLVPEAKLVYLVRDPIARVVSHYLHGVAMEGEKRPLSEAVADLSPRNLYLCASLYGTQFEQYLTSFPRDCLLVIEHDDLLHDRTATLRNIFTFLGVAHDFQSEHFAAQFRGSDARRRLPGWYRRALKLGGRTALARAPLRVRTGARARFERAALPPLPPVEVDGELRERLSALFTPEIERFRYLTGMKLDRWSV